MTDTAPEPTTGTVFNLLKEDRTFELRDRKYHIKTPLGLGDALNIMDFVRSAGDELTDPVDILMRGWMVRPDKSAAAIATMIYDTNANVAIEAKALADVNQFPVEAMNALTEDIANLEDVVGVITFIQDIRAQLADSPPQDMSEGLLPLMESAPRTVKIGEKTYKLAPFNWVMQNNANAVMAAGRDFAQSARLKSVNPVMLFLDGMTRSPVYFTLFMASCLVDETTGKNIDAQDLTSHEKAPALDVLDALKIQLHSASMQTFFITQSWNPQDTAPKRTRRSERSLN
jgi:hypothetical protein